jgi:RTX calcium-binding nonapeptide repeat (4 copies)
MCANRNHWARSSSCATFASIVAAVMLLSAPAAARAAEAAIVTGPDGVKTLTYRAGTGEINDVSLNLQGPNYTIQDLAGPPLTTTPPCSLWPLMGGLGTGAICPAVNVERIEVDLGDQVDKVFIGGISSVLIPATIRGGTGPDRMDGGEGSDTIHAVDQTADVIGCHGGNDTVFADRLDSVAADCETVMTEPAPVTEFPEGFEISVAVARAYRLAAAFKRLPLRVSCSTACTIEARLLLAPRRAQRLGLGVEIGRAETTALSAAGTARVFIVLTRRTKRALRRLRLMTATVEARTVVPVGRAVTLRTPVTVIR